MTSGIPGHWRVEGKLDKRSRYVADMMDILVGAHSIAAYRRSKSGIWSILHYGPKAGVLLGTVSHAEAFLVGVQIHPPKETST